ncbi:MAG TPA: histidine kinase [Ideonella sp.]|nr:histidine kinase [Ideonella sp.]
MTSTTWSATAPPARPALQRIAVRALRVAAIGALVGVALALVGRIAPASALAHSLAIALACWALIDGGRALFVQALRRRHPAHGMWPGWGRMSACIVLGAPVGALLGSAVGDWLSGTTTPPPADARAIASLLVLSVLPGFALTGYFRLRGRVADAQAQAAAAARVAAEQQLRLLQSQLEPHMLFNTLANLRVLIGLDAARAQAMLERGAPDRTRWRPNSRGWPTTWR